MDNGQIESKLREILLPVFGLKSVDKIQPEHSLVNDLGMDSIDLVEVVFLIERNFKVVIKANEIVAGGMKINTEKLFEEGRLTDEGAIILNKHIPDKEGQFKAGMTRIDLFASITVRDMANIIATRMAS